MAIVADVTKVNDISRAFSATNDFIKNDSSRRLWSVINNAGTNHFGPLDWIEIDEYRRVMEVNYLGPVNVIKQFLPLLKQTRGSRIINVSSLGALLEPVGITCYAPTKYALEGLSEGLAYELKQFGVQVAMIEPSAFDTAMVQRVVEAARQDYQKLSDELKQQYPPEESQRFLDTLHFTMNNLKQDPVRVVQVMERLLHAEKLKLRYLAGFGATIPWLNKYVTPSPIKQLAYAPFIPKAKSPAVPVA